MNTKNFKCFQVLYEEKNLVPAANKLFMSPQGLGKLIKTLEEEIGTPLFIRTKEGFEPTESGKIFYEKSKELEQEFSEMMVQIESIINKEKRFQIGFASGTIKIVDIGKLQHFMAKNPEVISYWLESDNSDIVKRVSKGDFGFGFVIGQPEDSSLQSVLLKSYEMVVYVYKEHPFWNREEINIEDIKGEKIISMSSRYRIHQDFLLACHMNGFHPNIIGTVNEGDSIKNLVRNRVGLGVCPNIMKPTDDFKPIRINGDYTWDVYGVYRDDGVDTEIVKKLIAYIK